MNPKVKIIKWSGGDDWFHFEDQLNKFAETHKVINISITTGPYAEANMYAAILYEDKN